MTVTWRQIAQCSRVGGLDEDDTTETEATTDWLSFASQIGFEPAQKNIKIRELGHFIEKFKIFWKIINVSLVFSKQNRG